MKAKKKTEYRLEGKRMTRQQKSNLAKTAIKLLEAQDKITFDMGTYGIDARGHTTGPKTQVNECGTNCCFAGYGPLALKNAQHYGDTWDAYIQGSFCSWDLGVYSVDEEGDEGDEIYNSIPDFLFGGGWPDDRKQAAARALYILNGNLDFDDSEGTYYKSYSKPKLIAELSKHIYKRKR